MLAVLVERQQVREWYTTQEFARAVGKAEFTIREYCRLGRLRAEKRQSGRGAYHQWVLPKTELMRYQKQGLLRQEQRARQSRAYCQAGGGTVADFREPGL